MVKWSMELKSIRENKGKQQRSQVRLFFHYPKLLLKMTEEFTA